MRAEVLHQLLRRHDRLGLERHTGRRDADQRPQRAQDQVHLGLVLAVGALALPQERRRVQPEHVDAVVGQREHRVEHRGEDLDVGPVQVPLEAVEGRPHPPDALDVGEAAGRVVGEHLGQRALVSVRLGAVGEDPVEGPVRRVAGRRGERPRVLRRGVVEHQVDAQRHAAVVQVGGQLLQVGHGAQPRVDRVVVDHRVAAVVVPLARCQQRHQVQVGDAELGQVVEPLAAPRPGRRRTGRRRRRSRPSGPAGTSRGRPRGAGRGRAARPAGRSRRSTTRSTRRPARSASVTSSVTYSRSSGASRSRWCCSRRAARPSPSTGPSASTARVAHPGQQCVEDGSGPGPALGTRGLVRHHRRS